MSLKVALDKVRNAQLWASQQGFMNVASDLERAATLIVPHIPPEDQVNTKEIKMLLIDAAYKGIADYFDSEQGKKEFGDKCSIAAITMPNQLNVKVHDHNFIISIALTRWVG